MSLKPKAALMRGQKSSALHNTTMTLTAVCNMLRFSENVVGSCRPRNGIANGIVSWIESSVTLAMMCYKDVGSPMYEMGSKSESRRSNRQCCFLGLCCSMPRLPASSTTTT